VAAVKVISSPVVIVTESKLISEAEVPTVRPVTISVPPTAVRIRAAAAVPVPSAMSLLGKPLKVRTPPEDVPAEAFNVMVAKIAAIPEVPISITQVAVTTASRRAFLTVVV
jgi:hypothetical protein